MDTLITWPLRYCEAKSMRADKLTIASIAARAFVLGWMVVAAYGTFGLFREGRYTAAWMCVGAGLVAILVTLILRSKRRG